MSTSKPNHERDKRKAQTSAAATAEEFLKKAQEHHQQGDLIHATEFYNRIIEQFPTSPQALLAKTLISGMQTETIGKFWDSALEARALCRPDEAIDLYTIILEKYPDSPEANNARAELKRIADMLPLWNAALASHAQGNEDKAIELYRSIGERFPGSPEAENAGFLQSIIHQNQFMPAQKTDKDTPEDTFTPAQLISQLLLHKKTETADQRALPPDVVNEELQTKKMEKMWQQAIAIEKDGKVEEAEKLYHDLIESSTNGHRVRDAKYRLEKITAAKSGDFILTPKKASFTDVVQNFAQSASGMLTPGRIFLGLACVFLLGGSLFYFRSNHAASWTDIVKDAKKSIVVVKTPEGMGSGFFISSDGIIFTNANVVGKNKEVEVRMFTGESRQAAVIRVGIRPLDIAVLKIEGITSQYLPMAAADECQEGEEIRAIGAPSGIEYFVTKGIISHCGFEQSGIKFIQTDVAMNAGNSGGPCISNRGKVIGMSTMLPLGDNARGLSVILPISTVKDFMEGKLVALEETFLKKEEEKAKEVEQNNSKFATNVDDVYKRLQAAVDREYVEYQARLDGLLRKNQITYDKGKAMLELMKYGPSGSETTSVWAHGLAMKVAKAEITEDDAMRMIKAHFKQ